MSALAEHQDSSSTGEEANDRLKTVNDVSQYEVASLGRTLAAVLGETAAEVEDADSELADVHRPVCERLKEIYEQLLASRKPLPLRLVDQFSDIVRRFYVTLERKTGNSYSYNSSVGSVASLCASRTVAGRNYGLHYDIDRLLLDFTKDLDGSAVVHQWKPSWKEVRQRQRKTLQSWVEDPSLAVESIESDAERSEALALVQSEAYSVGLSDGGSSGKLPPWFIPPHHVELGKHLADGSFGAVYEAIYMDTPVVMKQVLKINVQQEECEQFRQEVELWFSLNHNYLIKLYGACHEGRPFFVCERAMLGTIVTYTDDDENPHEIWFRLWEAARGLQYLHEHGIVHGDLKGNNILVGEGPMAKLADFGLSFATDRAGDSTAAHDGALGAFRWKAPEVLQGGKATFASDVYSFGMCIIEAVTKRLPWGNTMPDAAVKANVVMRQLPQRPADFSDEEWGLVERMCCFDPAKRITAGAAGSIIIKIWSS